MACDGLVDDNFGNLTILDQKPKYHIANFQLPFSKKITWLGMGKWGEKNKKRASSSMHTANEFHYGEEHVFV